MKRRESLSRWCLDMQNPGLAITGKPVQGDDRFSCETKLDDKLCKATGVQSTGAISLEKIFPRPGAATNGHARSVGVHDQLLPGKSVVPRSEERRVGKECVSTCRYRWGPYN